MAAMNRLCTLFLIAAIVGVQLVPPAEAGVKQFFKDTYAKVKRLFSCTSHETDDEHLHAIGKDGSVNTLDGIGEGSNSLDGISEGTTTLPTTAINNNNDPVAATIIPTTDVPKIDIRTVEGVMEGKSIIKVPQNCPDGFKPDPTGECREIV